MGTDAPFDYRRLSVAERLQLVEDIWDSIADEGGAELPLDSAERALLDRRVAEADAAPAEGRSWEEVRTAIIRGDR